MITPNDIETKVFSSSLRGYSKKEVDEFLDQVMIDYQALMDQNAKMLERVHVLQKQVAEAKDPARMTQDAKRIMNDISASAEQKAEAIIRNAKHDAENIVRNAKNSTSQADEDAERLRRKVERFKLRFKQLLEEEMERVDDNSEDLLDDLRKDFYPTLLYGEQEPDATIVAGAAAVSEDPIASLPDVEPTGDITEEDTVTEPDQNLAAPSDDLDVTASYEADVTEQEEDAEEADRSEEAEEETAEESSDAVTEEEAEDTADETAEEAADVTAEENHVNEDLDQAEGGVPAETIVIDRASLEIAMKGQAVPGDETLILERPEEITEAAAKYGEYDDPDRGEAAEEPEPVPETEEEQAAKYADYAADSINIFSKRDE